MGNRNVITLVAASGLVIFSGACARKGVDDAALKSAIETKLSSDAATKSGNLAVAVKDGMVTLSGDAPSSDVELAAMKLANGTDGVRNVSDQIKVTAPAAVASAANPPAANPELPPQSAPTAPAAPPKVAAAKPAPAPGDRDAEARDAAPVRKAVVPASATIAAGTRLSVRTIDAIDSAKATEGQTYRASLDSPLISRGRVVVPAGSDVSLVVTSARAAGRIKGNSELSLRASTLQYQGKSYELSTSPYSGQGSARGKNTAIKTGIGAAAGALIGGLAGGGKGAGIGAAAGGGAGFGWNALSHGQQVKIPAESVLNFSLQSPLVVPVSARSAE